MTRHAAAPGGPPGPRARPRRPLLGRLLIGGAALLGALLLAMAALVVAAFSTTPAFTRTASLTPQDIERVRALWVMAQALRNPQVQATPLAASARDVDLMAQEAAARLLKGAAQVALRPAAGDFALSVPVPQAWRPWPAPLWINLSGSVRESAQGLPELTSLRVGHVPVPPPLARWAVHTAADRFGWAEPLARGMALVSRVTLDEGGVTAELHGDPAFADSLRSALVSPALRDTLRVFNRRLVQLTGDAAQASGEAPPLGLWQLVGPMFQLAAQRSAEPADEEVGRTAHAALQNRAAMLTLALYVNGQPLSRLVPAARTWPQPGFRLVLGAGREDRPQHLLVAAVLAAEGGGRLADALGILKEVSDRSASGSGFSFDDLAADRAGQRLGQLAVRDPFTLQQRLAAAKADADLLPDTDGLPTFLDEATFRRTIGEEGSARYQALMADIEARVAAVPALR